MLGALRSALSAKLRDGELKVVQSFALADHKTKTVRAALDKLEAGGRRCCWWTTSRTATSSWARGTWQGVTLVASREVTTYDLLGHQQVLLSEAAARKLSEALSR